MRPVRAIALSVCRADPAFGASVAVRRLAKTVTLCDSYGVFFVALGGQAARMAS